MYNWNDPVLESRKMRNRSYSTILCSRRRPIIHDPELGGYRLVTRNRSEMPGHRRGRHDQTVNRLDLDLRVRPGKAALNEFLREFHCFLELLVLLGLRDGQESGQVSLGDSS